MGKHLWTEDADEQIGDNQSGCVRGVLHALDYHHWHYNVKKLLPHKKHNGPRHVKGNVRPKTRLNVHEADEAQKLLERGSGFPAQSRLQRTFSIHHLESLDYVPYEESTGQGHPIIFLCSNANSDTSATATGLQDQGHTKGTKKPIACNEKCNVDGTSDVSNYVEHKHLFENHTLCPEKFEEARATSADEQHVEANKDLLQKKLQNTDGNANGFHCLQASNMQARLAKSGSFPVADTDLSHNRNYRPSKLKNKQNEAWSFPKQELFSSTQAPKLVASKFPKDIYTKLGPFMADDSGGKVRNQDAFFSSMDSTQGLDKQGSDKIVKGPLYEDNSVYDLNKGTPTHIKRASSLNESLQRYAQLFENGFDREVKLHFSESLKLTNEYDIPSGGHEPISFKRACSLPHFDSYCSLQNGLYCDARFSGIPISKVVDINRNFESESHNEPKPVGLISIENCIPLGANEETECSYNLVEQSDSTPKNEDLASLTVRINDQSTPEMFRLREERDEQTVGESELEKQQEITLAETASNRLPPSPVSIFQTCFQEDVTGPADFPTSKGNYGNEKESSVDSPSCSCNIANSETFKMANKSVKNYNHTKSFTNNIADFNYVREVLEWSGLDGNGFLGPWHSMDQLSNPSMFEEVTACCPHKPQCCPHKPQCCHHRLLFDLINEVLLEIYESSFTYYPRALSFHCHVHPMPGGYRVLEEVWARISRTLSLRPEVDQSVDRGVANDLGKDVGWMNLQLETEYVALELEDLIFDQLVEQVICS
ncbi:unnamed protein product [Camellia sinensis]